MKRVLAGSSEYRPVLFVLLVVAILSQALVFAVYFDIRERTLNRGRAELKIQAENMNRELEEAGTAAMQLIQTANAVAQDQKSVRTLEATLRVLLSSTVSDSVYGMGIWSRPYQFQKNRKLFGPYVHRKDPTQGVSDLVLTYEWETNEYNYPEQVWYKAGALADERPIFTEPYVDAGMTWVSLVRAWKDSGGKPRGVLSVDLVLPKLQAMIETFNRDSAHHIYLTTRNGQLLAHPLLPEFLKLGMISQAADLIKISPSEYTAKEDEIWQKKEFEILSEPIKHLDWKLVIKAERSDLLEGAGHVNWLLLVSGGTMLVLVIVAWLILMRISRQLDLARAISANSAKMASLGEMAGGIAHEINTPLAIISLLCSQISREASTSSSLNIQETTGKITKIEAAVEKAAGIIRSLRLFSRDATEDPFQAVELGKVFHETLEICRQRLENHRIELSVHLPEEPIWFSGRSAQISQVILNLINNSADAIEKVSPRWIRISTRFIEKTIEIRIEDSGRISSAVKAKLFQPFFTTKDPGHGTGLGLSTSKQVVKLHGGDLFLDETKENTCFVIQLPQILQGNVLQKPA